MISKIVTLVLQRKPTDLFALIELAIYVGAFKYPLQFDKRKDRILKFLMDPSLSNDDYIFGNDDEEEDDDDGTVCYEDAVTNVEEEKQSVVQGTQLIDTESKNKITTATIKNPPIKIRLVIRKPDQVAIPEKQNNCNGITGTTAPPLEKQLLGDCSAQKRVEEGEQTTTEKQSHKGKIKKMETDWLVQKKKFDCDIEKKGEEGVPHTPIQRGNENKTSGNMMGSAATKQCGSGLRKGMPPPLKKMNVATKRVEVVPPPHQKRLLSDCSPLKQSNFKSPMQKTKQSSAVARPIQKATQSIRDREVKFESSKRKFEERVAEQREAKRRIIMVDFHKLPKPANDPRPPKRCWERRRF